MGSDHDRAYRRFPESGPKPRTGHQEGPTGPPLKFRDSPLVRDEIRFCTSARRKSLSIRRFLFKARGLADRDDDPFFSDFILAWGPMNRYDFDRRLIMTKAFLGSMVRCGPMDGLDVGRVAATRRAG